MTSRDAMQLAGMRRGYGRCHLDEDSLSDTWLSQFEQWFEEARASNTVPEPNAMVLATVDRSGCPSARTVLLKGADDCGFVFYTNLESRKGRDLAANPRASLVFPWHAIERQVIVVGDVVPVDRDCADRYFADRPYGSQIGAHASKQSAILTARADLERARAAAERQYPRTSPVPRPETWGGFRVAPNQVEFWQGRPDRLHDRLRYRMLDGDDWRVERLSP